MLVIVSAITMSTTSGTGAAGSGILDGKVPVFVFPVQLDFYYEDQTTHKRVVTIYNPYEFDVTFKVLCNNPKKYAVVEPEGKIFGQKCVDIVIRHVAVSPQTCETTDKFRVHMFEEGNTELLGKKDILATLHPGPPPAESSSLGTQQRKTLGVLSSLAGARQGDQAEAGLLGHRDSARQPPNYIACLAAVICILALFLPTEGDASLTSASSTASLLAEYPWLHLSVNQKLVFAYVLGLVTMAILRM